MTEAVEAILQARGTTPWVVVTIDEHEQEVFHQERPGRPNPQTKYRREVSTRYELRYELNQAALAAEVVNDGVFPLITNDRELSEKALLLAYKGQPVLRKHQPQAFIPLSQTLGSFFGFFCFVVFVYLNMRLV